MRELLESARRARRRVGGRRFNRVVGVAAAAVLPTLLAACGSSSGTADVSSRGVIAVVAAENQYGNVAGQIGGRYTHVVSIESNPNTDPHTYEVSPGVAGEIAGAGLVIQNGIGYDAFMSKIESASPNAKRKVIDVQSLLGLLNNTANPHLWYDPRTMPAVARAIGADLAALEPRHAAYFRHNVASFDASLKPWLAAIAAFKAKYAGTKAATTEPVADYLLEAMGINNVTPFRFQADVMNGTDPTPQDVALENGFFTKHEVRVFVYNEQVVDALTESIRANAQADDIPVVAVYETMPTPGYDYQSWMLAETRAIAAAVINHASALRL